MTLTHLRHCLQLSLSDRHGVSVVSQNRLQPCRQTPSTWLSTLRTHSSSSCETPLPERSVLLLMLDDYSKRHLTEKSVHVLRPLLERSAQLLMLDDCNKMLLQERRERQQAFERQRMQTEAASPPLFVKTDCLHNSTYLWRNLAAT